MKKIIALILTLTFVILCCASCNNEEPNNDPVGENLEVEGTNFIFRLTADDSGKPVAATIYMWTEFLDTITVPETVEYNGHVYPITAVGFGQGVTADPSSLKHLVLSKNVKAVADNAFGTCQNLSTIAFNEGLETIGAGAFAATAITTLEFPSTLKEIGKGAFTNCLGLKTVLFNKGIATIADSSFLCCPSVETISIPRAFSDKIEAIFPYSTTITDGTCKVVFPD